MTPIPPIDNRPLAIGHAAAKPRLSRVCIFPEGTAVAFPHASDRIIAEHRIWLGHYYCEQLAAAGYQVENVPVEIMGRESYYLTRPPGDRFWKFLPL